MVRLIGPNVLIERKTEALMLNIYKSSHMLFIKDSPET